MKNPNYLLLIILSCLSTGVRGQSVYTITADSTKLIGCDSNELIIGNHTQNVPGFLFNTGNGRTIFKRVLQKLNDSQYLLGVDTLLIRFPNSWLQGGNAFGTTGVLGTTDGNPLDLYTNNTGQARLTTNGHLLIGATADSGYNLDVKGPVLFGTYSTSSLIRGSLNFDNGSNPSYIMEQNSLERSLQIPGTYGQSPWLFRNDGDLGVQIVDASGTIALAGGKISIGSANFNNVGPIISTEPSTIGNETIYFGSPNLNHADENGTNVSIQAGGGGYIPNQYTGGNIYLNPGAAGGRGANGNILLGNLIPGKVGIQTASPVSNLEVDQATTAPGVVSNDAGSTQVRGTSTQFTNTFKVGDSITIGGQMVTVTSIVSDVLMTTDAITNMDSLVAYTLPGGSRFHVKGNGTVGVGVAVPTSQMDILAPKGYSQLRLRTAYTPTSSSDPRGNTGDVAWDENYIYVKTASGWKRSTLGSF